ncbi:MAG: 2-oxoacid:ferredoxin oxidoreductase subunit beta [Clostridiales bacterium]|nr:MAG: 2-oxoacid:ferredoxin oxidoreductase subunit beta [Clostridiales bacterium]
MASELIEKYMRSDKFPHMWCPGCGHGIIMRSIIEAIDRLGLEKDKVCVVSGIGCSSRAPGYMDFNTLHTTHGRALPFATGIKLANPDLHVIVVSGDGDSSAIGGNHLIHAARRNIDITTIVFNNNIYGMTGGQYSPTTPTNYFGTTAPYGNIDRSFDIAQLAGAAGATYTARSTVFHVPQLTNYIEKALNKKGFSLVEAISTCPTSFGRRNKKGDAVDMIKWLRDSAVNVSKASKMTTEEMDGKFTIGEFKDTEAPEYVEEYDKLIERLKGEDDE